MMKSLLLVAPLGIAALLQTATSPDPISADRDIASFFPADTVALVEAPGVAALLQGSGPASYYALLERAETAGLLPPNQRTKLEGGLDFAQLMIGVHPLEAGQHLFASGVALGLHLGNGSSSWGLVAHGDDEDLLDALFEVAFDIVDERAGNTNYRNSVHKRLFGADIWTLGDELSIGRRGALLFAAGTESGLLEMLSLAADDKAKGLTESSSFMASRDAARPDCTLRAWVDMKALVEASGDKPKGFKLLKLATQPQAQFLLGPGLAEILSAESMSASLTLREDEIELSVLGRDLSASTGLRPKSQATATNFPGAIATGLLYRDLHSIISNRNELFAPELQPKFSKGLGDIALLFGGMELDEDLLPKLSPWMEVVVADFDFGDLPRPDLALPGGALIMTVDPSIEQNMIAAFQTAIGLANTQRAQNGDLPLALRLALEGDVLISSGHMPPPAEGEAIDADYNLAPACAYADGRFILGTHESIVRYVIQNLADATEASQGQATESVHLGGAALSELANQSSDYLIMKSVLEDGKSFDEAAEDLANLSSILMAIPSMDLTVTYPNETSVDLNLRLGLASEEQR